MDISAKQGDITGDYLYLYRISCKTLICQPRDIVLSNQHPSIADLTSCSPPRKPEKRRRRRKRNSKWRGEGPKRFDFHVFNPGGLAGWLLKKIIATSIQASLA